MRHLRRVGGALAKQVFARDWGNDDAALLDPEATAPVTVAAGRRLARDWLATLALATQRLTVGEDAMSIERLCGAMRRFR
jgi:hypothetical protein